MVRTLAQGPWNSLGRGLYEHLNHIFRFSNNRDAISPLWRMSSTISKLTWCRWTTCIWNFASSPPQNLFLSNVPGQYYGLPSHTIGKVDVDHSAKFIDWHWISFTHMEHLSKFIDQLRCDRWLTIDISLHCFIEV